MSEIIILAEVINNTLKESTAEVISAASSLGDSLTVIVPGTSPESAASIAATYEGIERVIEISLSKEEQMEFSNSVDSVKGLIDACIKIDPSLGKK